MHRDRIKYQTKATNSGEAGEHEKEYIKIRLNSDDNLLFSKILKLHSLTIAVRSVFKEGNK